MSKGHFFGKIWPFVLLMRNRSGDFSVERLNDFLIALGHEIEITVRPTRKEQVSYRLSLRQFNGSSGWHRLTVSKVKPTHCSPRDTTRGCRCCCIYRAIHASPF